jgi:inhibitor of Bruton tyrosine kinase
MTSLRDNLFLLARSNDDRGIEKLFIRDSGELDERNDNGLTALHICATYGCVEACAILLKLGAKHSLQDFESGWTPLHRAFYFGNLKVTLLLIRAGALIADEGESRDWRTGVFSRRERWRSIRNLSTWKANIDHDGLSPLDLLSLSLCQNLTSSKKELMCTSVLSFGKADFTLGVPLPNSVENILRPRRIEPLSSERIAQIVASRFHSVALTRDGEVYSWGHGRAGRYDNSMRQNESNEKFEYDLTYIA